MKPCRECPFRKESLPGYLGGFTVAQVIQAAVNETDFICHTTREKDYDSQVQCAGRLLFASKVGKSFRDRRLEKMRLAAQDEIGTEKILNYVEFREHHRDADLAATQIDPEPSPCLSCEEPFDPSKTVIEAFSRFDSDLVSDVVVKFRLEKCADCLLDEINVHQFLRDRETE